MPNAYAPQLCVTYVNIFAFPTKTATCYQNIILSPKVEQPSHVLTVFID